MRGRRKGGRHLGGGESSGDYLASVSDVMSGLLFVFIIALAIFALLLKDQEIKKEQEVERLQATDEARSEMLQAIAQRLREKGIEVDVVEDQGVLRLGEAILFESGKADLDGVRRERVHELARALVEVLPCYALEAERQSPADCPPKFDAALVDALLIEGHTDDRPLLPSSPFRSNWDLSTERAYSVYEEVLHAEPRLTTLVNPDNQALLSISGYGPTRPVHAESTDVARAANRRIDLRFIVSPRRDQVVVSEVAEKLGRSG